MKSSIDKQASSDTCCWVAQVAGTLCFLVEGMRLAASSLALSIERESHVAAAAACPVRPGQLGLSSVARLAWLRTKNVVKRLMTRAYTARLDERLANCVYSCLN